MTTFIVTIVVLWALFLIFLGPKLTPYSRGQWALLMTTLVVLWIPMGWYLLFVVARSRNVDSRQVGRVGALNLLIGVPLFIFITRRWILKKR
jgi:threonine/homoserine/homoserine lactone efflux protein